MAEKTAISWTGSTHNFWSGCTEVSEGCDHCYARTIATRHGWDFATLRRAPERRFDAPLHWRGPRTVFTCSMSDFFHPAADAWRDDAWDVIRRSPHLTWQILTKRPQCIARRLPEDWGEGWRHVWLGTSVENQKWAELRIPILRTIPARVRFLSVEPLLERIDFHINVDVSNLDLRSAGLLDGIHWVIVGGESGVHLKGPGDARWMREEWARGVRDQVLAADVAFFFKQHSGRRSEMEPVLDGLEWREMPEA
jgi:protein gp37